MTDEELFSFLTETLVKIENIDMLMAMEPPRHVPSYQKIVGVQQKLGTLPRDLRQSFFPQLVMIRGVITYFLNGRYEDGMSQLHKIKRDLISIARAIDERIKKRGVSEIG